MKWEVGQTVMVQSRTWANINKPGGCAKIIKVHCIDDGSYVEGLDVKYVVDGKKEINLDPAIVSPYEHLERGGRKRRSREFLMLREEDVKQSEKQKQKSVEGKNKNKNQNPTKKEKGTRTAPAAPAEATGKENRSSRQSSTTCVTPEKPKPIKRPKNVTPVPKMVFTARKVDDVSPLIEDIPATSLPQKNREATKKNVARGLIFDSSDKEKSKASEKNMTIPAASLEMKNRLPPTQQPGKTKSRSNASALMDKKPAASRLVPPRKKPPPATKSVGKPSAIPKTAASKCGNNSLLAAAAKPMNRYKTTKASFSRVTSAYDKKNETSEKNRKPLLDVYRDEVQKARDFMEEMVRHRSDNVLDGTAASGPSERKGYFSTKSRYDEFLSHLYKVWIKIDEEEVSEETFREVYNQISSSSFTAKELDSHIQTMCDEGKEVMRSDGMLYRIH